MIDLKIAKYRFSCNILRFNFFEVHVVSDHQQIQVEFETKKSLSYLGSSNGP